MSRLYLFNPENDLALAHGKAQYTAPPNAQLLHNAGALLPIWFCENGDQVLAYNINQQWIDEQKLLFDIPQISIAPIPHDLECCPWGWSLNTIKQYSDYGVNPSILPNTSTIEKIRQLSHRKISIEIISQLKNIFDIPYPCPIEAKNDKDVINFLHSHQTIFIKSPWSSSGRGVICTSNLNESEIIRRALGIIRRQGSVMCEKALNKVHDFAMLFHCDGSKISYQGLSSFFNAGTGAYAGNIIGSQDYILQSITQSPKLLKEIALLQELLCNILTTLIVPHYKGYLGVDMMTYSHNGVIKIAPCIELNLRMTMGVVAMLWSNKYLAHNSNGTMHIKYSSQQLKTQTDEKPIIIDKKLKSGTISLIPPDKHFNITISVKC